MSHSPIVLFCYKRLQHLEQTLISLAENTLSPESTLYIYADGPRENAPEEELHKVQAVRDFVHQDRWKQCFEHVKIIESKTNRGLAPMVIGGVGEVIERHGKVIVLEDDVVVSPYFLEFMNKALELYCDDRNVGSIRAHSYDLPEVPDLFFAQMSGDFAWGTWQRVWQKVSFDGPKLLAELKQHRLCQMFDYENCYPYTQMLRDQIAQRNSSWGVRFYASLFLNDQLTLYPGKSLAAHIGYDGGTHFSGAARSPLDGTLFAARVPLHRIPVLESETVRLQMKQLFRQEGFASFHLLRRILKSLLPPKLIKRLKHLRRKLSA